MIPEGWQQKGSTAIVRMDTGDIIAKTYSHYANAWVYEVHFKASGNSTYGIKSLDDALAMVGEVASAQGG